jgi:hypothetical protein
MTLNWIGKRLNMGALGSLANLLHNAEPLYVVVKCMSLASATDRKFLDTLEGWLRSRHEVLVLIRHSHAAGAKHFEFFSSFQDLSETIRQLPPRASVIGFRQPQLPLRGVVDDDFIAKCLNSIPDGLEYLVVETVRRVYGRRSWFHHGAGMSHAELRDDLEESRGVGVAVGLYPPWLDDNNDVISAVVPDGQGAVSQGIY